MPPQAGSVEVNIEPKIGRLSRPNDPPTELPRLYQLVAFVPYSRSRRDTLQRDIGLCGGEDDWVWVRVQRDDFLPFEETPEALIVWKREFDQADHYGKPHFRLVAVTDEGDPVSPAPGIAFLEEESCDCPPGVCLLDEDGEEVQHHPV